MESQILELLNNKNISQSSISLYMKNLIRLNNNQPIKNFNFLKNKNEIMDKLEKYKKTTQRNYIISIVSILKTNPKYSKLYNLYYPIMMEFNKDLKNNTEKSQTQKDNWIEQETIMEIFNLKKNNVLELINNQKKITENIYNELLHLFILSLYCCQAPRRNKDYQFNFIMHPKFKIGDELINYTDPNKLQFIFNNYKTNKTYKSQIVDMSNDLIEIFNIYLKYHPLKQLLKKDNIPLLVNFKGEPFNKVNDITRILNKIFGQKIGVSLLRNIYLTNKYGNDVKELNEDVNNMGTSSDIAMNNYIKQ